MKNSPQKNKKVVVLISKVLEQSNEITVPKFKVLEFNQRFMAWLGIHSYHLTEPTNEFFNSIFTYINLLIIIVLFLISSVLYVYQNETNFKIMIQIFLVIVAGFQYGGMFISIGIKMKNIKILHLKLQEIVDGGKVINIFWPSNF